MPCARAKARGRPGSGGRHQQVGGPAPCGQSALSIGPETRGARRATAAARAAESPSGLQSKTRCGAPGWPSASACSHSRTREGSGGDEHPGLPRSRLAHEGHVLDGGESLVARRRLELAKRTHLRGRREDARLAPRQLPQLRGFGKRPETLEQPLDEVDLRLRERRVEPDAVSRSPMPSRRLDHVVPRRASEVRVVEDDPPGTRGQRLVEPCRRARARILRARRG